jgi:hypothetical protein
MFGPDAFLRGCSAFLFVAIFSPLPDRTDGVSLSVGYAAFLPPGHTGGPVEEVRPRVREALAVVHSADLRVGGPVEDGHAKVSPHETRCGVPTIYRTWSYSCWIARAKSPLANMANFAP